MDFQKLLDSVDWRPIQQLKVLGHDVYATHEGHLSGDWGSLRVFKLSNGERVFDADDIAELLGLELDEVKAAAGDYREMSDDE